MEKSSLTSSNTDSRSKLQSSSSNSVLQNIPQARNGMLQLNSNSSKSQLNEDLVGTSIVFDYSRRKHTGSLRPESELQEKEVKLISDTFEKK